MIEDLLKFLIKIAVPWLYLICSIVLLQYIFRMILNYNAPQPGAVAAQNKINLFLALSF
jgi:hypothetical protein